MAHNLKWDDLQIVLAVAQHRSLSGAARQIGVNHATILRRIEAMENNIGAQLFDRPPGGYRLRAEAQEVLSSLQSIAETIDRVERSLTATRLETGGSFRLTTTDSIANLLLPRHLEAFRRAKPDVHVELIVSNMPLDMTRPEAEITLRPARAIPKGMQGQRAASMSFGVFSSRAYLADNRSSDPVDHRWIGVAPPLTRSPVGHWQDRRLLHPPSIRTDSFMTVAELVAAGGGLAMLPTFVGRAIPDLVAADQFPDREETGVWVATHPDLAVLPQIAELVSFFASSIASDADTLA